MGLVGAKLQNATSDFFELDLSKNYSLVKWLP
ncbi:helix-turn-helix domain-containing protein [Klebsiella variicola]|uniref:Helix-turn-helix domain-containing protein n=1 Tax=Klebsiella variicola TaxID=244366 RepID=A0A7H4N488_KLEVA|nr:helix-turn-helix domain-containing protein [Klebsiella variicola]STX60656.1 helix-turn-helix domain-containing protein [Klebsiella variicola]